MEQGDNMTLRDQAIDAMYRADGERVGERVFVEKALDALLGFLRDNAEKVEAISVAVAKPGDPYIGVDRVLLLCDLLGGEQ